MKRLELTIIALAAAMLTGCSFGDTNDEPLTAGPAPTTAAATTPAPATIPAAATTPAPAMIPAAAPAAAAATPVSAKPQESTHSFEAHIDASAFLNALVESGCQIDKAEYKEVKRGGAIKVVCSTTVDALNVELDNL